MRSPLVPRHGGRSHRRLLALIAAPALGLSLLAATPSPAVTTDGLDETAAPDAPVTDFDSSPADVEPVTVTLITGDTVQWVDGGDGNAGVAEIEEASRDYPVYFHRSGTQEDFYVIPDDVMDHVASGALDRELFNIPGLIRQGLDDRSTGGELPVIVTFDEGADEKQLERDANALPATGEARAVKGITGAGVKVDRAKAAKFRDAVLGNPGKGKGGGLSAQSESGSLDGVIDKVLLDQVLQIDLAESVPQIGAPQAWDAGYTGEGVTVAVLDTGIDSGHPDLAGQVVAAANFTDEPDTTDTHGHGTHVASTVAGTGAASDGARTGVAPGAELLSGKVCTADGQCQTSAIMAGMEWATTQQSADVVNMSLGGGATDGTDPLSQLVNQLSAETGALFVTSAGNTRNGLRVVGSPAAADAALAVGAVDKSDRRAIFSSRGPRVGDHAVKPEITAPGVDIVAARAGGTGIGEPVDSDYTSLDGTSMASPHVAGAAALLAQAKPGLGWSELKDALVSTAADGGYRWYEQGTGRLDVPAALGSPVYAKGTLNFGGVDGRAEQELVYTNRSDDDITLSLSASPIDLVGRPAGGVTLSTDTLTVPAHGNATVAVAVTLDPSSLTGQEAFGGVITATAPDNVALRTGIGFGPPLQRVTIEVLDSNGDRIGTPTAPDEFVRLTHDTLDREIGGTAVYRFGTSEGIATGHVPAGTYTAITDVQEMAPHTGERVRTNVVTAVEVDIHADTTITLDSRHAVPIRVTVPHRVDKRNHAVAVIRELAGHPSGAVEVSLAGGAQNPVYATPAPPGELAPVSLFVSWTLAEPQPLTPVPWDDQRCPRLPFTCYSDAPAYVYNLPILYGNGIPNDLHERITRRDLVEVPTRFHSDHPDSLITQQFQSFLPFTNSVGVGVDVRIWFRPGKVTEYFLADDRVTWRRIAGVERRPAGEPTQSFALFSDDRFPAAEAGARRGEEHWHEAPIRMGMWDVREESLHNPVPIERFASASRNGPHGEWFAVPFDVMGSGRSHGAGPTNTASWRMWNADTGTELERTGVVFPLAPKTATYRLEQVVNFPPSPFLTGQDITTWTFTSRPSDAQVPQRYKCWIQQAPRQDVCQIQPLIRLEYHLGLDINNQAPAGRAHRFAITAGQHSKAIDRAPVTSLQVQASFDDGYTWRDARVVGKPKDSWDAGGFLPSAAPYQQFQVVLAIPPLHRTTGFVTLRVQATDANGGTVDQTIHRAYLLKTPSRRLGGKGRFGVD